MGFEDGPKDDLGRLFDLEDHEQAILNATRGLSPECVAACIEAVKAGRDSDRHMERCAENRCKDCGPIAAHARKMYFDAVSLLSKE